jgi:YjbR
MAKKSAAEPAFIKKLRAQALKLPEAEEGIACKGTALECPTVMVRKKAFLFLAASQLRLKLDDSLAEAESLAAQKPDCCKVGGKGWVTITYADLPATQAKALERWVEESYRLFAPKK